MSSTCDEFLNDFPFFPVLFTWAMMSGSFIFWNQAARGSVVNSQDQINISLALCVIKRIYQPFFSFCFFFKFTFFIPKGSVLIFAHTSDICICSSTLFALQCMVLSTEKQVFE